MDDDNFTTPEPLPDTVHYMNDNEEQENHIEKTGLLERTSIERAKAKAKIETKRLNNGTPTYYHPNSVPLHSNLTRGKTMTHRRVNPYSSRMRDWNDSHNAAYTQALQDVVKNGRLTIEVTENSKESNDCHPEQVFKVRTEILHMDLEGLKQACMAEAFYCMNQLCEGVTLSSAIHGGRGNEEFIELDINTTLDAFYETYVILSLACPWKSDSSSTEEQQKNKAELDKIHDEVEETRKTFVSASKDEGITKRSNHRCTLQDIQHQLVKLAGFIQKCIVANKEQKSFWSRLAKK